MSKEMSSYILAVSRKEIWIGRLRKGYHRSMVTAFEREYRIGSQLAASPRGSSLRCTAVALQSFCLYLRKPLKSLGQSP